MYDSRLGRWMSLDPLAIKYPSLSAYNFVANSPLLFIDPDGRYIRLNRGSSASATPIIFALNEFMGISDLFYQKESTLNPNAVFLLVNEDLIKGKTLTKQQQAVYDFFHKHITDKNTTYDVNVRNDGNEGDPIQIDSWKENTIFSNNISNNNNKRFFTPVYTIYHFFSEQVHKKHGLGYTEAHNKVLNEQAAIFGYKYTSGFYNEDGSMFDVDILTQDNKYIATFRTTVDNSGEYKFKIYNRKGVSVGDEIDPNWQGRQRAGQETNGEIDARANDHFKANK